MPRTQIPLIGDEGLYIPLDPVNTSGLATYPFYLNGYFEKGTVGIEEDRKVCYVKRPGFSAYEAGGAFSTTINGPYSIQGMIASLDRTNLYIYLNDGVGFNQTFVYSAGSLINRGTAPAAAGHWTYTGPVVFSALDGISYGAGNFACVTDFNKGAVVAVTGIWTEITDAVFTGLTKVTNFAPLDGYLFIGTSNNRIYNCDLNTPTTWKATSFLTAADTPGQIIWLSRIRNFIVAFKQRSMEFFEDVGNPSPGSPLEPRRQYNRTIGCINPSSIQEMSDGIIFAGSSLNNAPRMYKLRKDDLQIVEISSRYVQQCLSVTPFVTSYQGDCNAAAGVFNCQSQAFGWGGKELYLINLKPPFPGGINLTHVYDNDLGVWTAWGTSLAANGVTDTNGFLGTQGQMVIGASGLTGVMFALNTGGGGVRPIACLYFMDLAGVASNFNDVNYPSAGGASNSFPFSWTSDILDFGSRRRKFMDSLELLYDGQTIAAPNLSTTAHPVTITYTDYNHNIVSGYYVTRTGYIDQAGGARCVIKQMGSFFRRAFNIKNATNCFIRVWGIEIDYNEGESDQDGG
jgi:hypothetical protein